MEAAALVLARTLHIGSAMLLFAIPYFMLVILRPVSAAGTNGSYDSFCRCVVKWLWAGLILEAISGFCWFWFVTAQIGDQSPWGIMDENDLTTVLWQTRFGQLWLARAAVGIALGVALYFLSRSEGGTPPKPFPLSWFVLIISGVLLITLAWAGHAAAGIHFHALHLIADTLHLLIGAIWPVGLIPLGLFLWHMGKSENKDYEQTLHRFSQSCLIAVPLLLLTGIIISWLMLGSWEALLTTAYGKLLSVKILVVACNRFYLLPRLRTGQDAFQGLRIIILAESSLAMVVIFMVGILGAPSLPS
jgi:putative copper resistance protein D